MQSAYIHLYLIMINVITFALYGLDKWRAMTRQWRVREKKLIILALIGGSIGALIGMTVFHHKTRKMKFRILVPIAIIIWLTLGGFLADKALYLRITRQPVISPLSPRKKHFKPKHIRIPWQPNTQE